MIKKTFGGVALAALLLTAACGDEEKPRLDVVGRPDSAVQGTSTTVGQTPGGQPDAAGGSGNTAAGGGAAPNSGGGAANNTTDPNPTRTTVDLPMEISVAKTCIRAGENQTVTITTRPGAVVGYNALYSDGKSGGMDNYYGGNAGGEVDKEGVYENTYTINPTAPEGLVKVETRGARGTTELGYAATSFKIANRLTGKCS